MNSQLLIPRSSRNTGSDARAATGRGSDAVDQAYYLIKASGRGGGPALWRALLNAVKCEEFEVQSIPLHSKANMYLIPAKCIDIDKIWSYSILFALVKEPDFKAWCDRYEGSFLRREKNKCKRIKVRLVKRKIVDEWGWEWHVRYLVINDGEKEYEVYPNAATKRLVQGKGSDTLPVDH